jgi:hypothetical protein
MNRPLGGQTHFRTSHHRHRIDPGGFMKKFLAIYLGTAAARKNWDSLNEAKRQELQRSGVEAWHAWVNANKTAIVEMGSPLGKTKRISRDGITDARNDLGAYTVVKAESYEAAAKMFEKHPHFMIFPGEAVEVMECLPIPQ